MTRPFAFAAGVLATFACTPQSTSLDAPALSTTTPVDAATASAAPVVEASAQPIDAALEAATPDPSAAPHPGKRAGASCARDRECAAGLTCCESGFVGQCGGANTPDVPREPCTILHACARGPCRPMDLPP